MKDIQIHCVDKDGEVFIMNRMTSENSESYGNPSRRDALIQRAKKMAYDWSICYPFDKFLVVEV